jgi:hypothetical protein
VCEQLCSALLDTSNVESKTGSCTRKACCRVLGKTNEVGRWLVLFEAGPPQSVIGLTATCIPSLKSANRPKPLLSEAPVSQKLQRLCVSCAPSAESDDASLIHDHKFVSIYVFSLSTRLSRKRQAQNWGKIPLETTLCR